MYTPLGAEAVARLEARLAEVPALAGGSASRAAFFDPGGGPFGELEEWRRMAEAPAEEPGELPSSIVEVLLPPLAAPPARPLRLLRAPWQRPQLAPCASSGRVWWPRAARHSQGGPRPLGSQPPPQLLERAASKVADSAAFDHAGKTTLDDDRMAASMRKRPRSS